MKKRMKMNRFLWIILILVSLACLSACSSEKGQLTVAPSADPTPENRQLVSSIEIYNRTGRIQREDFYDPPGSGSVSYSVHYNYTDAGRLSSVTRNGGEIGTNRPIETYFYKGENCTQRIQYDSSGATQTVYYWTYNQKNVLLTERIVSMIPAENGFSYSGKKEEITEFNPDGTAKSCQISLPGDYGLYEYDYGTDGRLLSDRYSHSSDGKTFRLFETRTYSYDGDGRLTRQTIADALGNVTYLEVVAYTDEGGILTDITYSSDEEQEENVILRKDYTYGENGLLTALEETSDGETRRTFFEYNSMERPVITTVLSYSGDTLFDKTVTTVEYDTRFNPVMETVRSADGTVVTKYICEYSYYDDGKIKTKTNFAV